MIMTSSIKTTLIVRLPSFLRLTNLLTEIFNLTAALDYYGSERARADFYNNRGEPSELVPSINDVPETEFVDHTRQRKDTIRR